MRSRAEIGNGKECARPLSAGRDWYSSARAESFRQGAKQLPAPRSRSNSRPSVGDEGGVGQASPSYFLKSSRRARVLGVLSRNLDLAFGEVARLGRERWRESGRAAVGAVLRTGGGGLGDEIKSRGASEL